MVRERHSILFIFRFNADDPNPIRCGMLEQARLKQMKPGRAFLVVGIVDSSKRMVTTPMEHIPLTGINCRGYNGVLRHVDELNQLYHGVEGYASDPTLFGEAAKEVVLDKIRTLGTEIYQFLESDDSHVVQDWLRRVFEQSQIDGAGSEEVPHHVTIVTNDFSVPWYWLRRKKYGPCLCEIASVGMLQLATYSASAHEENDGRPRDNQYRALFINGSPDLPYAESELYAVRYGLTARVGDANSDAPTLKLEAVASAHELSELRRNTPKPERVEQFRIVHFSGHFEKDKLVLEDKDIAKADRREREHLASRVEEDLAQFVKKSLLVLDGCSSSKGLNAWTDMESVTARMIRDGALGCVVTVLPVKNDPIVSEVLWGTFYRAIRAEGSTIGQALHKARRALKEHLQQMESNNPIWAFYQLIGNPALDVFAEEEFDHYGRSR